MWMWIEPLQRPENDFISLRSKGDQLFHYPLSHPWSLVVGSTPTGFFLRNTFRLSHWNVCRLKSRKVASQKYNEWDDVWIRTHGHLDTTRPSNEWWIREIHLRIDRTRGVTRCCSAFTLDRRVDRYISMTQCVVLGRVQWYYELLQCLLSCLYPTWLRGNIWTH